MESKKLNIKEFKEGDVIFYNNENQPFELQATVSCESIREGVPIIFIGFDVNTNLFFYSKWGKPDKIYTHILHPADGFRFKYFPNKYLNENLVLDN